MQYGVTQVAERALFIWNNDEIVNLINQNRALLFPIVLLARASAICLAWRVAGSRAGLGWSREASVKQMLP